jgi:hypothetical protein
MIASVATSQNWNKQKRKEKKKPIANNTINCL